MELYYKVIKIEQGIITYTKDYKSSEPLFARRGAITEAEQIGAKLHLANSEKGQAATETTILVTLCFSPIEGHLTELPIHNIYGNEDLSLLTHHSWPLETSLYFQYQYDTGGDIANYMGVLVLPDVMDQAKGEEY